MALVNMAARNATMRCVTAMDVLSLPKKDFTVLAANLPDLRQSFERPGGRAGAHRRCAF